MIRFALPLMMLALPAQAFDARTVQSEQVLNCTFKVLCVNEFECERGARMEMKFRAYPDGSADFRMEAGDDPMAMRNTVDDNGVLFLEGDQGGMFQKLIVAPDGSAVTTAFAPGSGLSTVQIGICHRV